VGRARGINADMLYAEGMDNTELTSPSFGSED
jgi:hypothetical protein